MRWSLLFALVAVVGCGASAVEVARGTLTTAATATVQADKLFADAYEVHADNARASSSTQVEKDAKMADWTQAAAEMERALRAVQASLVAAEVALDGFERTGEAGYYEEAIACAAETLRQMARVLEERGLKTPPALAKVLALSKGLVCAESVR